MRINEWLCGETEMKAKLHYFRILASVQKTRALFLFYFVNRSVFPSCQSKVPPLAGQYCDTKPTALILKGRSLFQTDLSDPGTQIWVSPISMLPYGVSFTKLSVALQNKESHKSGKIKIYQQERQRGGTNEMVELSYRLKMLSNGILRSRADGHPWSVKLIDAERLWFVNCKV